MTLEKNKVDMLLRYRWAVFGILAIAYFFVYFHRMSSAVVSTDLQITFGVGMASVGLLSSTYFYAYAIMQLPSGLLSDSLGPRKTVSIFTLVAASGAILTGIASTFNMVIVGRLLIGIGVAMVYIPTMKILTTWYRKNEFASLSGILLAVGNLGALSAAGPLALMSSLLGWQQVFIILGVITPVLAVSAWIIIRDYPSDMNLPSILEIETEEIGNPVPEAKTMERIPIVGTSTAALNIFPYAGGAILQQISGLMLTSRSLEAYQNVWLFMLICMVIATVSVFLSKEKEPDKN